jgi:mannose-6-phosphate isomerase-like protein (cupin superfamily)
MMQIRKLRRTELAPDNGLRAQRLMPWSQLNAPFEGSWCVVAPGAESGAHAHHEYEIWIALAGSAEIRTEAGSTPFVAGDVVHFSPRLKHQVVNEGTEPFEMYSIWWDSDLAAAFSTRDAVTPRHLEDA